MEGTLMVSTILLSIVAILFTIRYGREAGKRLEEMKTMMVTMEFTMDKEVLEEIKGKLRHLQTVLPKHKHKKDKHDHKHKKDKHDHK